MKKWILGARWKDSGKFSALVSGWSAGLSIGVFARGEIGKGIFLIIIAALYYWVAGSMENTSYSKESK